jgi:hypothetical protein
MIFLTSFGIFITSIVTTGWKMKTFQRKLGLNGYDGDDVVVVRSDMIKFDLRLNEIKIALLGIDGQSGALAKIKEVSERLHEVSITQVKVLERVDVLEDGEDDIKKGMALLQSKDDCRIQHAYIVPLGEHAALMAKVAQLEQEKRERGK